jgi:hypothetical protein
MNHTNITKILISLFAVVLCFGPVGLAGPVGTAFTYQGRLIDANQAADGLYDFQFKLYDSNGGGNKLGQDVNKPEVDVIDGYFTVELDFGSVFDGNNRWLDIGVRPGDQNDPCVYSVLSPRQKLTPAPYALYAKNGGGGGGGSLWQVNGTSIYYNNGNVGIGTSSPGAKLEVAGQVKITGGNPDQSSLLVRDLGGYTILTVRGDGYIGVRTESPTAPLEVAGRVKIADGTQGEGKVLTSDAAGLASWQIPSAGVEIDPTVPANLKDGVSWSEVSDIPAGFADGIDNVGITTETDPTVPANLKDGVSWSEVSGIPAGFADGVDDVGGADNLGNHTATQNIKLSGFWLSGDGGNEGVYVANDGSVGIGTTTPSTKLDVNGDVSAAYEYKIAGNTVLKVMGLDNTFLGRNSGKDNTTGNNNTFSGYDAGYSNTTGYYNTFSGAYSGSANTTGSYNTFSGAYAGFANTSGGDNTFSGNFAGKSNIIGFHNTFLGSSAGSANTAGSDNTFSGYGTGFFNTTGSGNTFSGSGAGYYNSDGYRNTFSGYSAGRSNTGGYENTFSGYEAGWSNTLGYGNTCLGYQAGRNSTGSRNVFLGRQAGYSETGSEKLYIANYTGTPLIYGDFATARVGIHLIDPSEALDVDGTARLRGIGSGAGTTVVADSSGKLWKQSSSQRYKTNIETLDTGADAVLKLRPVRFEYKESGQKDIGLIAEEVEKISPDLVIYDGQGKPDAVKYDKVALYLLSVVKNQQKENEDIKNRLAAMESLVSKLSQPQDGGIK